MILINLKFPYTWHFQKPVLEAESIYSWLDTVEAWCILSPMMLMLFFFFTKTVKLRLHICIIWGSGQRLKSNRDFIMHFVKWPDLHNCPWSLDDITNEKHDVFWLNIYQLTGKITCNLIGSAKQIMHLKTSGNCKYTLRCCYQL